MLLAVDRRSPASSSASCPLSGSPGASSCARNVLIPSSTPINRDKNTPSPPYSPAVTSARMADSVSRAMILRPIAACIGTSNNCLGMTLSVKPVWLSVGRHQQRQTAVHSFFTQALPTTSAFDRWTMSARASTGFELRRKVIYTMFSTLQTSSSQPRSPWLDRSFCTQHLHN